MLRNGNFSMPVLLAALALASCGGPAQSTEDSSSAASEETGYMYGDGQKYQKFWEDKTIYNETVTFVEEDGMIYGKLLYAPTEVISVRDYTTEKEIDESQYRIEGDRIYLADGSELLYFTAENMVGEDLPEQYGISTYEGKEHPIMFTEGPGIVMHQINVTYRHEGSWDGYKPSYFGNLLPNAIGKLKNKEHLTIGFYGDSIMTGCNASSKLGIAPYLEDFPTATVRMLKQLYGYDRIESFNTAQGGTLSYWGWTNIDVAVNTYEPDLVFIGFGMNDGSWNVSADDFISNMDLMIASIKARNPNAEVIAIATILANPDSIQSAGQENYLEPLKEMVAGYQGAAVLDMTSFSEYLLSKKRSLDILANNINHPSDFLVRCYTSSILTGLCEDF